MALTKADKARIGRKLEQQRNESQGTGGAGQTGSVLTKADHARIQKKVREAEQRRQRQAQERQEQTQERTTDRTALGAYERHSIAPSIDRTLGTDPVARSAAGKSGYYPNPVKNFDTVKLENELTRLQEPYTQAVTQVETTAAALKQAGSDLDALVSRVNSLYESYQKAPSEAMAAAYKQAYAEYESGLQRYNGAAAAYDAAYSAYEPVRKEFGTAVGAYNWYGDQLNAWRSTVRDADSIRQESEQTQAQIKALEEQIALLEYPTTLMETGLRKNELAEQIAGNRATLEDLNRQKRKAERSLELLREELDWSEWFQYADLRLREDFAEKSAYSPKPSTRQRTAMEVLADVYPADEGGWEDPLYEFVNGNEDAGAYLSEYAANYYGSDNPLGSIFGRVERDESQARQMEPNEVAIFNYLYETQGKEAAHQYYAYLQSDLNARERKAIETYWATMAAEDPVGGSIFSVAVSPLKGLSYLGQISDFAEDGKIDQNAGYNQFSNVPSAIRNQVTQQIESGKWGKAGGFAYQTAMSMADFVTNTALSGGNQTLALAVMGTGAAADATVAAKDRGLSDGQAFALGTVAGLAEVAMEKVSLDTLLDPKMLADGGLKYVLKNMVAEGLEEVGTDVINLLADILIAKDESEWRRSIEAYVAAGKSPKQAFGLAVADQAAAMWLDFWGGAISGGVMSGGPAAVNAYRTGKLGKQVGELELSREDIQSFIDQGLQSAPDTEAYQLAQKLQKKLDAGRKLSDHDLGALYAANIQAVAQEQANQKPDSKTRSEDQTEQEQQAPQQTRTAEPNQAPQGPQLGEAAQIQQTAESAAQARQAEETAAQTQRNRTEQVRQILLDAASRFPPNHDNFALMDELRAAKTEAEAIAAFTDRNYAIPDGVEELMTESVPARNQESLDAAEATAASADEAEAAEDYEAPAYRETEKERLLFRMRSRPLFADEVEKLNRLEAARDDLEATGVYYDVEQAKIDRIRRIAEITGARVVYQPMAAQNGKVKAGRYSRADNTIYLNPEARGNEVAVFAHELTHSLEETKAYARLREHVESRLRETGRDVERMKQEKITEYREAGIKLTPELAAREIVAEFVAENLLSNEQEIRELTKRNRSLAQKIGGWIHRMLARLGNKNAQERKFLEEARELYALALAEKNIDLSDGDAAAGLQEWMETRKDYDSGNSEISGEDAPDQYSIVDIHGENGDYGKGVLLDTNIFAGVKPRKWGEILGRFVYRNLAGAELTAYDPSGNPQTIYIARATDRVKKDGAKNAHKVLDKLARVQGDNIKSLAIVHLSELLETSLFSNATAEHNHQWLDANGWEYRTTYIQDASGNIYEATLNIAKSEEKNILYAVNLIKKIDKKRTAGGVVPSSHTGRGSLTSSSSGMIVADDDSVVKTKEQFSIVDENNDAEAQVDMAQPDHWKAQAAEVRKDLRRYGWALAEGQSLNEMNREVEQLQEKFAAGQISQEEYDLRRELIDRKYNADPTGTEKDMLEQFSISPTLEDDLKRIYNLTFPSQNNELYIGESSNFLTGTIGAELLSQTMPANKAYNAMATEKKAKQDNRYSKDENYHGLEVEGLKRALIASENPVAAFVDIDDENGSRRDRIVLITDMVGADGPVAVVVQVETMGHLRGKRIKVNKTITSFDRRAAAHDIRQAATDGRLLHLDKKRSQPILAGAPGANYQEAIRGVDFKRNIQQFWENVKWERSGQTMASFSDGGTEPSPFAAALAKAQAEKAAKDAGKTKTDGTATTGKDADQFSVVPEDDTATAVREAVVENAWDNQSSAVKQSLLRIGRELQDKLCADFGIKAGDRRVHLSPIVKEMWQEYLGNVQPDDEAVMNWRTRKLADRISGETQRRLFETAWSKGELLDKNRAVGQFLQAMKQLNDQLKMVERLMEDQADQTAEAAEGSAEQEETGAKQDMTPAEVEDLLKRTKKARYTAERVQAATPLTKGDMEKLDQLMRREIHLGDLDPENDYVDGIKAVYEAKQEYEKLAKEVRAYRRSLKARRMSVADALLVNAEGWKDKKTGLQYSRETMERNIRDVVKDPAVAQKLIDTYIAPVKKANAEANKLKNRLRDQIRALDISRKVDKRAGNANSESYAVQFLGEAQSYIRQLQFARGNARYQDSRRGGKTLQEWEAEVQEFRKNNPNLDYDKIQRAINVFGKIYEDLFDQINQARIRNGYEPMGHRDGYFPHFQSWQATGYFTRIMEALGYRHDVTPLPTTIAGRTADFKPGTRWMANALERKGFETTYDALEGFDRYIETAADVIHLTDCIQNIRSLAEQVRYRTSDAGLKERVDKIRSEDITEEEKQSRIREIYDKGKFSLSNFAVALDEYANILAGKKSRSDRNMEQQLGRGAYNVARWFEKQTAANMVAGNIGSALTNLVPLQQGWATIRHKHFWRGVYEAFRGANDRDGFRSRSTFLINRAGSTPLAMTTLEKFSNDIAGWLMEFIDTRVAESLVRGRYYENTAAGMSEEAAIDEADAYVAGLMADRSKGAMPSMFYVNNPLAKLVTQFQLEVNNQFSFMFKDMPRDKKDEARKHLLLAFLQMFLGAYVFNDLMEKLLGRRVAFDPVHIAVEVVEDLAGLDLPNVWELPFDAVRGEFPVIRAEKVGLWETLGNLGTNVAEELPFMAAANFVGWDIDAGRIPVSSAVLSAGNVIEAFTNKDLDKRRKVDMVLDELKKPVFYTFMPFGGGQLKKMIEGAEALSRGGSYSVNTAGEDVLQYPFYSDEGIGSIFEGTKSVLFGRTATEAGQDWVDSGFGTLSAKQTAAYQAMLEEGAGQRESFDLIRSVRSAEKTETMSRAKVQNRIVAAAGLPHSAKAMLYELEVLDNSDYRNAREFGLSPEDAYTLAESQFMLEPDEGEEDVSKEQKWRAAYKSAGMSEEQQMRYLASITEGKQREKLAAGYSFGVPPGAMVRLQELLPEFDEDGNGSYTNAEVEAAIDSMNAIGIILPGGDGTIFNLTNDHMAVLWQAFAGTDKSKNNPYSSRTGQEFLDLITEE